MVNSTRILIMNKYDHTKIEKKWQGEWEKHSLYKALNNEKNKKYVLDMFPYPSGASMHVGHLEGYVGTDILSRFYRMNGFSVLHPMGWDAFGLPAENYAIKTGIHPDKSTHDNIKTFKRQLESAGLSYDWSREIDTSRPEFYKWTQWIFIQMFKAGLAYKKKAPVNWCPKDETVLADEQVVDGKCERCDTPVIQKELDQWFLKITDYADRLISGLDKIDWLPEVKRQQINWIGRSEGSIIKFDDIEVFTTRSETINSATFIAVAGKEDKFTGSYVKNPASGERIPVWEASYVLSDYGTGAIMGVPGYNKYDASFAKKHKIDIVKKPFTKESFGEKKVSYHLRDWLISRQRYWGCPIPMIYCEKHGWLPVSESELPFLLPSDVDFLPHGESPIARSMEFQKGVICPKCGKNARREVDTMDTYVDSSWYFLRFCDPKNNKEFASKEKIIPVDEYVGGGHVVQHLLFARFFWKFLYDADFIGKSLGDEPFLKLRAPGWILGSDSRKMSKRWNNVITPDEIIPKFGADTLRVYEMFMGPFDVMKPWSTAGVEGASRFLGRVWRLFMTKSTLEEFIRPPSEEDFAPEVDVVRSKLHQTIKKVTEDITQMKFNTAISALMELVNVFYEYRVSSREYLKPLALLLAPFAPHMAEELWVGVLGEHFSVHKASWPRHDANLVKVEQLVIVIQVNGKVRSTLQVESGVSNLESRVIKLAKEDKKVSKWLDGRVVKKTVFVPGKLVNFVV